MLTMALTPLGLYVTITVILVLTTLVWWQRQPIKRFLRSLCLTEISLGPVKLGRGRNPAKNWARPAYAWKATSGAPAWKG